jgi:hypothetical protein
MFTRGLLSFCGVVSFNVPANKGQEIGNNKQTGG